MVTIQMVCMYCIIIIAYVVIFIIILCNIQGASEKLTPVDDNRFMELTVEKDCELQSFIEEHNLTFQRGAAFYEFTRAEEDIVFDKEIILMDKV